MNLDDYTRVYIGHRSRIAHLSRNGIYGGRTVCGMAVTMWWYGTGSQDEYEHAAALTLCPKCAGTR